MVPYSLQFWYGSMSIKKKVHDAEKIGFAYVYPASFGVKKLVSIKVSVCVCFELIYGCGLSCRPCLPEKGQLHGARSVHMFLLGEFRRG